MVEDSIRQLVEAYDVGELLTRRVLVVDDEILNCEVVAGLLEPEYEVRQAQSGERALEIVDETPIDLIIADQRMPGMSGVELLELVRQRSPDIAGILLTAYTDSPAIIAAINQAGAFRYLTKPWEAEHIELAVAEASQAVYQRRAIRRLVDMLAQRNSQLRRAMDDLKAAQERLLHMERLSIMGRLTAGIAHELRNLLSVLRVLNSDFEEVPGLDPELVSTLGLVNAGVGNLLKTLQTMNEFARQGRLELTTTRVEPRMLIQDALAVLHMDLEFRTRDIEVDIAPELSPITCDRPKLTLLLVNLLRNAMQATEHRTPIRVVAESAPQGRLILAVEDRGTGVAPERADDLFEAFASSKGAGGLGMGLYMSRLIAHSHGGDIRYKDRPGGGARFEVLL